MSSYTERHRRYYQEHKSDIQAKEHINQRWKSYYERNKEAVKTRNLNRYHHNKQYAATPGIAAYFPATEVSED